MADHSSIEWTDATWNPITGCTLVSEGCRNCYAARLAATRLKHLPSRAGLARLNAEGVAKFTGEVRFNREWLTQPLKWKRPRMIFVCAHGDLFAEGVPDEWIDQVFAVMALAPQHTFQVLTKRPKRMREYFAKLAEDDRVLDGLGRWHAEGAPALDDELVSDEAWEEMLSAGMPLPNVWLGSSIEDQAAADARVPQLIATPAAVRFVSAEPLLGPIELQGVGRTWLSRAYYPRLDWVIVGGESGPGARPMHPEWALSLRDQCAAAGVPFFFKQWGEWADWPDNEFVSEEAESLDVQGRYAYFQAHSGAPSVHMRRLGKAAAGRLLDGVEHNGMPARAAA